MQPSLLQNQYSLKATPLKSNCKTILLTLKTGNLFVIIAKGLILSHIRNETTESINTSTGLRVITYRLQNPKYSCRINQRNEWFHILVVTNNGSLT